MPTVRTISAAIKAAAQSTSTVIDPTKYAAGVASTVPVASARASIAQRLAAELEARAAVVAGVTRLPQSQHVFLTFELERTLIPYIAERG